MNSKTRQFAIGLALATCTATTPALALEKGDWIMRLGVTHVSPDDDSDPTALGAATRVGVDSATSLGINFGYMLTDNIALDILGALPFKHDIVGAGSISGLGKIGETKHLPPTVGIQYHFQPKAKIRPYIGAGVNYTTFFSEETTGALSGTDLKLDDSWGLAAQAGVDFDFTNKWFGNFDVRYINIETEAHNDTAGDFDVQINPWVVTLGIGTRF